MNNTKKLTTGAMLLAIVGAVMLIDRQLSFIFQELIVMLAPAIIIIYATMYDLKDGAILSVSLLILGFLLGSTYTFCYMPLSIIVGMGYSFGIKKDFDKTKLMLISMGLFILGEVLITFIVTPIIGISIPEQLTAIKETYDTAMSSFNISTSSFDTIGVNLDSLILIAFVLATILMGVSEGLIIHILSMFLLTRFKIKTLNKGNFISFNLHPIVAYICFVCFASLYFMPFINNETIKLIIITLSLIGAIILAYYGYVFLMIFLRYKTGRKSVGFLVILGIILLFPFSVIVLAILGFLYGTGPLKRVLINMGMNQQ